MTLMSELVALALGAWIGSRLALRRTPPTEPDPRETTVTLEELHTLIGRRLDQDKRLRNLPVVAGHYSHGETTTVMTDALGVYNGDGAAVISFHHRTNE